MTAKEKQLELVYMLGSTQADKLIEDSHETGKWTAADVVNWFTSRRAAFIPSHSNVNRIAMLIN